MTLGQLHRLSVSAEKVRPLILKSPRISIVDTRTWVSRAIIPSYVPKSTLESFNNFSKVAIETEKSGDRFESLRRKLVLFCLVQLVDIIRPFNCKFSLVNIKNCIGG